MKLIKKVVIAMSFVGVAFLGWYLKGSYDIKVEPETLSINSEKRRPLLKYSIENLNKTKPGEIKIVEMLNEEERFTSYIFDFTYSPDLNEKVIKKQPG